MKKRRVFILFIIVLINFFSAKDLFAMDYECNPDGDRLFHAIVDYATTEKEAQNLIGEALERYDITDRRYGNDRMAKMGRSQILDRGFLLAIKNNLFQLAQLYRNRGAYYDRDSRLHENCRLTWALDDMARDGTVAQVKFLLGLGAKPLPCYLCCRYLPSALHRCIDNKSETEALKMIPLLVKQVNVNNCTDPFGKGIGTALHRAASRGSLPLIKLLIQLGADPNNNVTYAHATPLDYVVEALRHYGARRDREQHAEHIERLQSSCKLLFQYGGLCHRENLAAQVPPDFMQECRQARADFLNRQKTYDAITSNADFSENRLAYYRGFYVDQLDKIFNTILPQSIKMPTRLLATIAHYSGNLAGQEYAIMENFYTRKAQPETTCALQ